MTLWRLEWLRLVRTRRWIALSVAYVFFGLIGPVVTRYQQEIFRRFGGDIRVIVPRPTPPDGVAAYVKNASQVSLLVAVAVAAGALAFDARAEWAAFLRTRVRHAGAILLPKFTVSAVAVALSFVAGALAAWYETTVLIGPVSGGGMMAGMAYGALYLVFAVAVVALAGGVTRSVIGTIGLSLVVLVVLPIIGSVRALAPWMPSHLVGALEALAAGAPAGRFLGAAGVTAALTLLALGTATKLAGRREL